MAAQFSNPYRVPGDPREYILPRDLADLDKAWDAYRGGITEAADVPAPSEPTGANLPGDPEAKKRHAEAVEWIAGYKGTFGLILDLRADRRWGSKWFKMTERQVDAVLRSKERDLARTKERAQTGRDLTILPIGRTAAAVTNDEGHTTFLLIDRPADLDRYKAPNKWAGWVFVKQFIGGIGEGQRLGSQRPGESYTGQWANLIDKVLEDPDEAVARFGRELGICGVCMLPLTNEESRELGIGPVCRKKLTEARG